MDGENIKTNMNEKKLVLHHNGDKQLLSACTCRHGFCFCSFLYVISLLADLRGWIKCFVVFVLSI